MKAEAEFLNLEFRETARVQVLGNDHWRIEADSQAPTGQALEFLILAATRYETQNGIAIAKIERTVVRVQQRAIGFEWTK